MTRRLSMTTRRELTEAVGERYRRSDRNEKRQILDEFVELTGYHRKHAIRVLCRELRPPRAKPGPQRRYDDEVRAALITLWEAADRICGKRLKALIPTLIDSMTRHGHLSLAKGARQRLKQISAATIDRLLRDVREQAFSGKRRRAGGVGNAIRRAVPIRTFTDWNDPLPGYLEIDFVEHCGGTKIDGDFVHSFVMTDIATGWTECLAMPFRSGALVLEHVERVSEALPFPLRGLDCDNDSAFMNEAVFDFCKATGIELTRSRAYKKNDQAWVEQKNGAIVRRLVGYGRLRGLEATETLASLYQVSRLYINFFQPSFKLKSKTRHGAKVTKRYEAPLTPLERVLRSASIPEATKRSLRARFRTLDPLDLLRRMREAQQRVAECSASGGVPTQTKTATEVPLADFLSSLGTAWQGGEIRPTHNRKARVPHDWRTREDPFEHTWPKIQEWLETEPGITAKQLYERLTAMAPTLYSGAQLRTLQRRVKAWRSNRARELVTRILSGADAEVVKKADAATQRQPSSPQNDSSVTVSRE
ncbi:integrase catalytic domain-containing protein [Paraburkholderia phenoliruptrix]|uniref:Integrase catalytic region n=2 Tax=Paraburkholderia phenoliruptrix TaxID=252970 RepID=K0DVC6_9BURK|nr:DDE-type integrase/transposase/recombinase [Paraburkholderia phenoliruptrix]AFT90161.1 integrase catalytic region [Paraburkholderia phenoliruptrix BR3459a]